MQDDSRSIDRKLVTFVAGTVAACLVVSSPPAYADPSTPAPPAPVIVPGVTVTGEPATPIAASPAAPAPTTVQVQNAAPKAEKVAPYSLEDLPGTFTYKVTFPLNDVQEQHVLAADSNGKALDPSRVRVAYLASGQLWSFSPATGNLEKVGQWPTVYPAVSPRASGLAGLFGGPVGPEWLETARKIAVAIAAAVIIGGFVAAFAPVAFATGLASVPLAW